MGAGLGFGIRSICSVLSQLSLQAGCNWGCQGPWRQGQDGEGGLQASAPVQHAVALEDVHVRRGNAGACRQQHLPVPAQVTSDWSAEVRNDHGANACMGGQGMGSCSGKDRSAGWNWIMVATAPGWQRCYLTADQSRYKLACHVSVRSGLVGMPVQACNCTACNH